MKNTMSLLFVNKNWKTLFWVFFLCQLSLSISGHDSAANQQINLSSVTSLVRFWICFISLQQVWSICCCKVLAVCYHSCCQMIFQNMNPIYPNYIVAALQKLICVCVQDFEMNGELKMSVICLLEEVLRDPDLLPQERKATANILRFRRTNIYTYCTYCTCSPQVFYCSYLFWSILCCSNVF